jgi:L-amino acid N-acyltransferase YncA
VAVQATIRLATEADLGAIAEIHDQAWNTVYRELLSDAVVAAKVGTRNRATWSAFIDGRFELTFVAEAQTAPGGVVGFVHARGPRHHGDSAYDAEITHLYVRADARGAGLGRRLMAVVAGALLSQGKHSAVVRVFKGNPYEGFYLRLAGRHTAERPFTLEGHPTAEMVYAWDDLRPLAALTR